MVTSSSDKRSNVMFLAFQMSIWNWPILNAVEFSIVFQLPGIATKIALTSFGGTANIMPVARRQSEVSGASPSLTTGLTKTIGQRTQTYGTLALHVHYHWSNWHVGGKSCHWRCCKLLRPGVSSSLNANNHPSFMESWKSSIGPSNSSWVNFYFHDWEHIFLVSCQDRWFC